MEYHCGRLQVLPTLWDSPKIIVKQLTDNWFIGNKLENITLSILLVTNNVKHLATNKNAKCKSKTDESSDDNFVNISSIRRCMEVSDRSSY